MSVAIITGAAGLIGSEAVRHFASEGMDIVGIDNDMRSRFFGAEASGAGGINLTFGESSWISTEWNLAVASNATRSIRPALRSTGNS